MKNNDLNSTGNEDQKLIEDHVYLEIEDKGNVGTAAAGKAAEEKAAAAAVMMDTPAIDQPVKKRSYGAWWAAALFALLAVGCCIYLATRDSEVSEQRSAQSNAAESGSASFASLKDQVSDKVASVADKTEAAVSSTAGKVKNAADYAIDAVANGNLANASGNTSASVNLDGVTVYGKYPYATEAQISKGAKQGKTIDYLYYFGNDKSAVADNVLLNDIAQKAQETGAEITITAYASATGSAAYNANLCNERAQNLEEYLEAHGVSADHIKIVNGGQTSDFGSDAYCRRADIVVDYAG